MRSAFSRRPTALGGGAVSARRAGAPGFRLAPLHAWTFEALDAGNVPDVAGGGCPLAVGGTSGFGLSSTAKVGSKSGSFGGTGTDFVTSTSNVALPVSNVFTIAGWAYVTSSAGVSCYFSQDNGGQDFTALIVSGALQFYYRSGTHIDMGAPTVNGWQHLAFVLNGSSLRTYVDGVFAGGDAGGSTGPYRGHSLYVGDDPTFGNRRLAGLLDEWGIWDSAFSADDVADLKAWGDAGKSIVPG